MSESLTTVEIISPPQSAETLIVVVVVDTLIAPRKQVGRKEEKPTRADWSKRLRPRR